MSATHVSSDPTRRIELEGVGPAERPLDLGRELIGFETLGYRLYHFRAGQTIAGDAEDDEVLILILGGQVELQVDGGETWMLGSGSAALDDLPVAVYLPPQHHYQIKTVQDAQVGYVRSPARGRYPPCLIRPEDQSVKTTAGQSWRFLLTEGQSERLKCAQVLLEAGSELELEDAGESIIHLRLETGSRAYWVQKEGNQALADGDALMARDEPLDIMAEAGRAAALCFWTQTDPRDQL